MNREHDDVSKTLSSPDATPASTWNRGNAFRHLALAGWDPKGLSERDHLLEALKYIEVEIDRVEARDRLMKETKPQDTPASVSAGWSNDYTSQIPTGHQPPMPYFPPGVRVASTTDLKATLTPHLPNCETCGKELYQDPQRDFALTCPDGHYQHTGEQRQVIKSGPVHVQPAPVAGTTVTAPSSAFAKYQRGPVDQPEIPGDRTQRLLSLPPKREPVLEDDRSAILAMAVGTEPQIPLEALEQGADPEPSA